MLKWVESFNKTVSRRTYLQSCQHTEPDTQGDGNVPVLRLGHSHRLLQSQPLLYVQTLNSILKKNMRRATSETQANAVGYQVFNSGTHRQRRIEHCLAVPSHLSFNSAGAHNVNCWLRDMDNYLELHFFQPQ